MGESAGVDDVLGAEPAFAGEGDAEIEKAEMGGFVGIGVNAAKDSEIAGLVPPAPVEVEAPGVGVEFDPSAVGGRGRKNFRKVDGVGLALEQEAAGGVAEAGDVGVFDGANDTIGHFLFIGGEAGVDGSDDVIQFLEERVGKIKLAAFEDIALGAGEESARGFSGVEGANFCDLFFEAWGIEAVGLERGFGVIGDPEPFEAEFGRGLGHGGEGILPITGDGVVVEATTDLGAGEELGEGIFFGGVDFPAVFAEFRGNKSEAESAVEGLLVFEFEGGLRFSFEQTPFAEVEAAVNGALAEGDIVFLGTSEVSEGGGPSGGGDNAKIAGDATGKDDAGFGFPVGDDLFHVGGGDKSLHDFLRFFGGGDEIEVFNDFLAPAKAAGDFGLEDGGGGAEVGEKGLGGGQGRTEAVVFTIGGAALDGVEQVGGGFRAEAGERGEATVLAGLGEGGD